ncbi:MAG TPA: hemerythrin domain-containing protein [Mycobacteriales bacterium]|nr:hemerythrin domain-containing protein [Mycobacteriales bacterium]
MAQNVIDLLTADHREVTELVQELLGTEDLERRRELADTIIGELVRHSVAEETVVYPVIRKELPDGDQAVEHDTEEHKELERLMKEMEGCKVGEPYFLDLVGKLQTVLADHVADEEQEQFPQLRTHLDEERLTSMGAAVEALKKVAPTRPHPAAPNDALFHMVVGPGVGMIDRMRDVLTTKTHV